MIQPYACMPWHACCLRVCAYACVRLCVFPFQYFFNILRLHNVTLCFTGRCDQAVDKVSPVSVLMNSRRNRKCMLHYGECYWCWLYNVGAILLTCFLSDLAHTPPVHVPKLVYAAKIRHSTGKVKANTG